VRDRRRRALRAGRRRRARFIHPRLPSDDMHTRSRCTHIARSAGSPSISRTVGRRVLHSVRPRRATEDRTRTPNDGRGRAASAPQRVGRSRRLRTAPATDRSARRYPDASVNGGVGGLGGLGSYRPPARLY
jgi:hypothetical protein